MAEPRVFFVHLRRPGHKNDQRDDPFYEFGSFGCTGCHSWNLLHRRNAGDLDGARLGFVQGGADGSRLVFLTPAVNVKKWVDHCEVKWTPAEMPFKYTEAPVLVSNDGTTDFPLVMKLILTSRRTTSTGKRISLERRFASKVRSLTRELDTNLAKEIIAIYTRRRKDVTSIASAYHEALPFTKKIDANRRVTYRELVDELSAVRRRCVSRGRRSDQGKRTCH